MARIQGLKAEDFELQMGWSQSSASVARMPRADDCHNCGQPLADHGGGKCLFDASNAHPITKEEFVKRFAGWVSGQKIEDALANIVYELTGGNR